MLNQFYSRHPERGFTLIELMIVVAILGVITMVAVPNYQEQVRKAKRAEAKTALTAGSQAMERCFTVFSSYTNPGCPSVAALTAMGNGIFSYTITASISNYTIQATAISAGQLKDLDCRSFVVNNIGFRSSKNSGGTTTTDCW